MQLSSAVLAAAAVSAAAQPHERPANDLTRRRTRTRSYLASYASRRRAPRFRIR